MHGKVGELVIRRVGDQEIVGRVPNLAAHPPTVGQQAVREQFRLATIYGHTALADPATSTLYHAKAKAKGQPVFSVAVADFFHAPAVNEIDLAGYTGKAGETIHIRASDDFEVVGVGVRITDANGATLEEGGATHDGADGLSWHYQAKTSLPDGQHVSIDVTATDRPGHKGTKTATK